MGVYSRAFASKGRYFRSVSAKHICAFWRMELRRLMVLTHAGHCDISLIASSSPLSVE